jgi:hypothetical protein
LKHEYNLKIFRFWLILMQVRTGKGKVFQICGIVALFVLIVILPVSATGIAPVTSPGELPYRQWGHFALPTKPWGLLT